MCKIASAVLVGLVMLTGQVLAAGTTESWVCGGFSGGTG